MLKKARNSIQYPSPSTTSANSPFLVFTYLLVSEESFTSRRNIIWKFTQPATAAGVVILALFKINFKGIFFSLLLPEWTSILFFFIQKQYSYGTLLCHFPLILLQVKKKIKKKKAQNKKFFFVLLITGTSRKSWVSYKEPRTQKLNFY